MDQEPNTKAGDDAEDDKLCDEDGWMVVSATEASALPPRPESPKFELVCDKDFATKTILTAKRKRSKKDITKSYAVVKPEEVPCEDWHSCEKCFSSLIDNIPFIDDGEEDLFNRTIEGSITSSHCSNHPPAGGPIRRKKNKMKRSTAMYQIHEDEEDKENRKMRNVDDKSFDEYEVMENEYICETDRSEKERKIQNDIESSSLKYDYWDSYPKKSNNHRKSNPFPRQRIKESKFWGGWGDWRSLKRRFHYS